MNVFVLFGEYTCRWVCNWVQFSFEKKVHHMSHRPVYDITHIGVYDRKDCELRRYLDSLDIHTLE